jgi:hypothetical protein
VRCEHSSDLVGGRDYGLELTLGHQGKCPKRDEIRFDLHHRTSRNGEVPQKVTEVISSETLSNVRGDRKRSSTHLATEVVTLRTWDETDNAIDGDE